MLRPTARGLGTCLLYTPQVLLLGHLFITYGYNASPAYGVSMTPTIDFSGEVLIVSKQYRRGRGIQVGDLVSFRHPVLTDFGERAVKRVIGMPGDFVLRDTPGHGIFGEEAMIQVPEGHCYVAGDNLKWSRDSRMFGPFPLALIRGKVIAGVKWQNGSSLPRIEKYGNGLQEVD